MGLLVLGQISKIRKTTHVTGKGYQELTVRMCLGRYDA